MPMYLDFLAYLGRVPLTCPVQRVSFKTQIWNFLLIGEGGGVHLTPFNEFPSKPQFGRFFTVELFGSGGQRRSSVSICLTVLF